MEQKQETNKQKVVAKEQKPAKIVSKSLEAARRLKGSLIVNDPAFLL